MFMLAVDIGLAYEGANILLNGVFGNFVGTQIQIDHHVLPGSRGGRAAWSVDWRYGTSSSDTSRSIF
jgi:hypothetical protein